MLVSSYVYVLTGTRLKIFHKTTLRGLRGVRRGTLRERNLHGRLRQDLREYRWSSGIPVGCEAYNLTETTPS